MYSTHKAKVVLVYAMEVEEGMELQFHSFLVSVLDENESILMYTLCYLRCVTVTL